MKSLAQRQLERVQRKAENAVTYGETFDTGRGGVGDVDRRYVLDDDADAIDAATDAAIGDVKAVIGGVDPRPVGGTFTPPFQHKVKLSGV